MKMMISLSLTPRVAYWPAPSSFHTGRIFVRCGMGVDHPREGRIL